MKRLFNALFAFFLLLSFALNSFAQASGWGLSANGRIGYSTTFNYLPTPQTIPALPDATGISGSEYQTLFLRANGTIGSSGSNADGLLGVGYYFPQPALPSTVINLNDVTQVAAGKQHSTALKSDGTVWCWGVNFYGQLGIANVGSAYNSPAPVQSLISNVVQVTAGSYHTLALTADGSVWAWGNNFYNQLGQEPSHYTWGIPAKVGAREWRFRNMIAVAAGEQFGVALRDDGTVWVWGNDKSVRGDETLTLDWSSYYRPTQVPDLTDIVQISAGESHILALGRDGRVYAWGRNYYGQVGVGQPRDYRFNWDKTMRANDVFIPAQVDISDVVEIKAGGFHSLARKRDGSVWAWGDIHNGALGNNMAAQNSLFYAIPYPVQAFAGTGNALIGAASRTSFAAKPVIQTPAGFGVKHYGENVRMLFADVTSAGETRYMAFDPAATNLNVPQGYAIQANEPAYNVTTTAQVSGETEVCIKVNEYNRVEFPFLKILHAEGKMWVDRTFSSDYARRMVCARVNSPSSFVIAKSST